MNHTLQSEGARRRILLGASAAVVACFISPAAQATVYTWDGGGTDGLLSTAANWSPDGAPAAASTVDNYVFNATGGQQPVLDVSRTVTGTAVSGGGGLNFNTATGGWTLGTASSSNTLTLKTAGIRTDGQTSGTNTINANLVQGTTTTWYLDGSAATAGTLQVNGVISGSKLTVQRIGTSSTPRLDLANANTFSSSSFTGIEVAIGNNSAFGAGLVEFNTGAIRATGGATRTIANNVDVLGPNGGTGLTVNGNENLMFTGKVRHSGAISSTMLFNGANHTTFAGATALEWSGSSGNRTITLDVNGTSTVTVSGNMAQGVGASGIGGFEKKGAGVLTSSGTNTYTGRTTVSGGKFILNGTHTGGRTSSTGLAAYAVASGGTLGGTGTITTAAITTTGAASRVEIQSGGKLESGLTIDLSAHTVGSIGTLDISGAVGGANVGSQIIDASHSTTTLNGILNIGSGLLEWDDFDFLFAGTYAGNTYTLFDTNSAINGTLGANFAGTLNGYNVEIQLANSGQDIILTTIVPEPATAALAGLASLGLLVRRNRRRA